MSVRVLGAGGTIAATLEEGALRLLPVAELCEALPPGLPLWNAIDLESVPSSALRPENMLEIARQVCLALREGAEGVVVTHGTDTMEETAFLTDLLLGDDSTLGGAVFTGAMRWASDPTSDGPGNLADAIRLAADPVARGQGVLVTFAGEIHAARWVTKSETWSLQPYRSLFGAVGHSSNGGEPVIRTTPAPRWSSGDAADTQVALVKAYPGMSGTGIEALVTEGIRGVVIEGFGVMNVPDSLMITIEKCIDLRVAVVVASRSVTTGGLDQGPPGHRLLHQLGAIGSYGLSANKAWVALMVGLARTDGSVEELRRWLVSVTQG